MKARGSREEGGWGRKREVGPEGGEERKGREEGGKSEITTREGERVRREAVCLVR